MNFREVAVHLVKEHDLHDLCEVGVWRGDLAQMLSPIARTLVLVDPWSTLWNDFDHKGERYVCNMGGPQRTQQQLNEDHEHLKVMCPNALMLRMPSSEAARHVPDGSLDFVFIDAIHTFQHVTEDYNRWFPKLRIGGIIAGDDYVGEVKRALEHYCHWSIDNVWWSKKQR